MARQTQNYLRSLFAKHEIAPRRQFGQNFLIDLNLHDVIVEEGQVGPADVILEVGPGAGALTRKMADLGATVVAVEIDRAMAKLTQEAIADCPNASVLQQDALASKNRLAPEVVEALESALAADPSRSLKLVANLPYSVATPIIVNLLVHETLRPVLVVATIQLELAQRMLAPPNDPEYSALSVMTQSLGQVEIVRTLPPTVFWPRPKVESAIIKIRPDPELRSAIGDLPWFQHVVRQLFCHRRKNIRRVLHGYHRDQVDKAGLDAMFERIGVSGDARAEIITSAQLIQLARSLKETLNP